jgi:hypothetical protein
LVETSALFTNIPGIAARKSVEEDDVTEVPPQHVFSFFFSIHILSHVPHQSVEDRGPGEIFALEVRSWLDHGISISIG